MLIIGNIPGDAGVLHPIASVLFGTRVAAVSTPSRGPLGAGRGRAALCGRVCAQAAISFLLFISPPA